MFVCDAVDIYQYEYQYQYEEGSYMSSTNSTNMSKVRKGKWGGVQCVMAMCLANNRSTDVEDDVNGDNHRNTVLKGSLKNAG